jgi:hypothetical protein
MDRDGANLSINIDYGALKGLVVIASVYADNKIPGEQLICQWLPDAGNGTDIFITSHPVRFAHGHCSRPETVVCKVCIKVMYVPIRIHT